MKRLINRMLGLFGFQIRRVTGPGSPEGEQDRIMHSEAVRKYGWLTKYQIDKVIDIGANDGHFANESSLVFTKANYYCFEPIPEVFKALKARFLNQQRFTFFNFALGATDGTENIHISEYSPSSSMLEMADLHKDAFAFTKNSTTQEIAVAKLDNFLTLLPDEKTLVKIDVQGYEMMVIRGGVEFLGRSKAIIIEMSFEKLYEGQFLYHDVYSELNVLGFDYHGNIDQLYHPVSGEILQADCFFARRGT